ncbi:MAG: sugar phosphate isomerase/epimerase [Bacteroidia bacterium]|nr:sugar phosphate isomerase/epimerase [Bacteroidia bacterium]
MINQINTNRRIFIRNLGLLTTALLANGFIFSAPKKSKMKLGLVTYLWGKDWDIPTLIKNCTAANILGVELRVDHAHGVGPGISAERRKEVKKMFADSPMKIVGMGTNQQYDFVDQAQLKKSIEETKAWIKLSKDVGGTGVKVKPNAFHKEVPREKTIEQIGKALNEVGKYAADNGQKIRLEVHGTETQELPNIKAIMDVADNPNVFTCWNSNDEDLIGGGLAYNFNLVKNRQGDTVHVRELNIGSYPYQDLMNLFVGMDYDGWILLECRTEPEDKVAAMKEQYEVFNTMVKNAKGNLKK